MNDLYDLIYAGGKVEDVIKAKYPEVRIKDASDCIHTERFECYMDGIEEDEFYIFAIREGFAECCLGFNLMMGDHPEGSRQKVWDWFAEAKALDESEKEKQNEGKGLG